MKGINLFCSSSASTAVTSSMDHHSSSMVRRRNKRYANIGRKSQPCSPCSSQLPINPRPYHQKHRKSEIRRKSSVQVNDLHGHHTGSSTRHLLGDTPLIDGVSEFDKIGAMATAQPAPKRIVVLRVSLHCKACEGKVRKHISKMQGVTSFSIDMETKKVTIIGHVTPLGVLASVSKVKKAQLWPSPTSSSSSSLSSIASSTPTYQCPT